MSTCVQICECVLLLSASWLACSAGLWLLIKALDGKL